MTNQSIKVVLTAPYFGSLFQIAILEHFKKLLSSENLSFRSSTNDLSKQSDSLKKILMDNKPTVMIAISMNPDPDIISLYKSNNVPIVLLDGEAAGASTLATDNYKGGQIAAEHFISKGKKKIAIVNGRPNSVGGFAGNYCAKLRLKGFTDALKQRGLSIPVGCNIEVPNYSREDGVAAMPKLIDIGVDAIFCAAEDSPAPAASEAIPGPVAQVPSAPALTPPALSPNAAEVVKLSGASVGDEVIIAYVQNCPSPFNLSVNAILASQGSWSHLTGHRGDVDPRQFAAESEPASAVCRQPAAATGCP